MQMHLGATRNNNRRLFGSAGPDVGCDSIGDWPQAAALGAFLDRLEKDSTLPKTILYNNNPMDNFTFATMIGNFQGGTPGKLQFGSGWWHADQQEGMEWQIKALANTGLLSRFVGFAALAVPPGGGTWTVTALTVRHDPALRALRAAGGAAK